MYLGVSHRLNIFPLIHFFTSFFRILNYFRVHVKSVHLWFGVQIYLVVAGLANAPSNDRRLFKYLHNRLSHRAAKFEIKVGRLMSRVRARAIARYYCLLYKYFFFVLISSFLLLLSFPILNWK